MIKIELGHECIVPGSVKLLLQMSDNGSGYLYSLPPASDITVGDINYATGVVSLDETRLKEVIYREFTFSTTLVLKNTSPEKSEILAYIESLTPGGCKYALQRLRGLR